MPGELCDPIRKYAKAPAGSGSTATRRERTRICSRNSKAARAGGVNYVLNVPPDKHGLIPEEEVAALMRLRKNAGI